MATGPMQLVPNEELLLEKRHNSIRTICGTQPEKMPLTRYVIDAMDILYSNKVGGFLHCLK